MISLTPSDIIKQLRVYLPWHSDKFASPLDVLSAKWESPNSMEITFDSVTFLSPGDAVVVKNMELHNNITATAIFDDHGQITLSADPDVTLPIKEDDPKTIKLGNFGIPSGDWNGIKTLTNISGIGTPFPILTFLPTPISPPIPPIGSLPYLIEERPTFKGIWKVTSVPEPEKIIVQRTETPDYLDNNAIISNLELYSSSRIVMAPSFERAKQLYTSQESENNVWLYLIPNGRRTSRDRNAQTDAIAEFGDGDQNVLFLMMSFSTVVFMDTAKEISAGAAMDFLYGEIYDALMKSLFGFRFKSETNYANFVVVPEDDNIAEYNSNYIAYSYNWQTYQTVDFHSGFSDPQDFAADKLEYIQHPQDLDNPEILRTKIKTR